MNIIKLKLAFTKPLIKRKETKYIVLHHIEAKSATIEQVHNWHLNRDWSGIGYNFYIRKDGTIYEGRPIDTVGAHTVNYNSVSVGVSFEGCYMTETMPDEQYKAGLDLLSYLKTIYPTTIIKGHKELQATSCPGDNFPLDKFKEGKIMTLEEKKIAVQERFGLSDGTMNFFMCYIYREELLDKFLK